MSDFERTSPDEAPITPADFAPLDPSQRPSRRWRPLAILTAVALLLTLAAAWFVLTGRPLTVQVTPASAQVELSGGLALKLGSHYLLRPGEYRLMARADGYHATETTVVIGADDPHRVELTLAPLPGQLTVSSQPTGAEVLLNGETRGTTPLQIDDVDGGDHTLTLRAPRYLQREAVIAVTGFGDRDTVDWQLEPAWGEVSLQTTPAGAEVSVTGAVRGVTPLTTELLQPGEEVTLKLPGYKQWQQTVAIEAGQQLTLPDIPLEPADGLVQVSSSPSGAAVTVNGRFAGNTPLELELSPDTRHELTLFLEGYRSAQRRLDVSSGAEQNLHVALEAQLGRLRLAVTPAEAEVRIDGSLQTAGATLELPARPHRLLISAPGYRPHEQTVTPRPGVEQALSIALVTEAEARRANRRERINSPGGQTLLLMEPSGTVTLGSSRREPGRRANETLREVQLQRPFYLAEKPVTNDQFRRFRATHSSSHAERQTLDTNAQPVVRVTWDEAARYCNWLSREAGLTPFYTESNGRITGHNVSADGYRLPSEAEWEWAARTTPQGDERLTYPWGEGYPPTRVSGNFADQSALPVLGTGLAGYNDGFAVSSPVGRFAANARGLYDIGGNVAEWVHDWYGSGVGAAPATVDPLGPASGEFRVIRGSSWRHSQLTELRLSFRDYGNDSRDDVGFRVARYAD